MPQIKTIPPVFLHNVVSPQLATQFGADIHLEKTMIYKGKTLKVPLCGAMSTFLTNNIEQCTCMKCRSAYIRCLADACLHIKQKEKGESEDE